MATRKRAGEPAGAARRTDPPAATAKTRAPKATKASKASKAAKGATDPKEQRVGSTDRAERPRAATGRYLPAEPAVRAPGAPTDLAPVPPPVAPTDLAPAPPPDLAPVPPIRPVPDAAPPVSSLPAAPAPRDHELPPGTEALQAAALQVIGAARAFLELAERAVQEPQVLGQVASAASAVARGVLGSLGSLASGQATAGRDDPPIEHIDLG